MEVAITVRWVHIGAPILQIKKILADQSHATVILYLRMSSANISCYELSLLFGNSHSFH